MHWVLLPGFDGTGRLFAPLKETIGTATVSIVSYSNETPQSYETLVQVASAAIPSDAAYILAAESFSGPIAIQAAALAQHPPIALVLCASFAACPLGSTLRTIAKCASGLLFRWPPPRWFVRRYLLGCDVPAELLQEFYEVLATVSPCVLERRLHEVLSVDVRSSLSALSVPVLYIRGTKDRLIGSRALRTIESCCRSLDVQMIDAPHLIFQRRPEQCVEVIKSFIHENPKNEDR
jgi:pimeloyl-ACP methyl ester carboxylesterase